MKVIITKIPNCSDCPNIDFRSNANMERTYTVSCREQKRILITDVTSEEILNFEIPNWCPLETVDMYEE